MAGGASRSGLGLLSHHPEWLHSDFLSSYPNTVPAAQIAARLAEATRHPAHAFWPDGISLLGSEYLLWDRILSSRHVTDAYLLALAVAQGGRFVTLDRGVALTAVRGATADHLVVLSSASL